MSLALDEVGYLLEGLIGSTTLSSLRRGDDPDRQQLADLDDDQYAILVRWLSGERITAPEQRPAPRPASRIRRLEPVSDDELSFMDEEDRVTREELDEAFDDVEQPRRPPGRKFDSPGITLL